MGAMYRPDEGRVKCRAERFGAIKTLGLGQVFQPRESSWTGWRVRPKRSRARRNDAQ